MARPVHHQHADDDERIDDLEPVRDRGHWQRKLCRPIWPGITLTQAIAFAALIWAALFAPPTANPARAEAGLSFNLALIEGDEWRAEGLEAVLHRGPAGLLSATLRIASLDLPEPIGRLGAVAGECRELRLTRLRIDCRDLDFALPLPDGSHLRLRGALDHRRDNGAVHASLAVTGPGAGHVKTELHLEPKRWRLVARSSKLDLGWAAMLAGLLDIVLPEVDTRFSLALDAEGSNGVLARADYELALHGLNGSNEAGTLAGEGIDLALSGSAWQADAALGFDLQGQVTKGEAYVEPVYLPLEQHPPRFALAGTFSSDQLHLDHFEWRQSDIVHAHGSAHLAQDAAGAWQLEHAALHLPEIILPGAYHLLLQPFLAGSPLGDLQTEGRLQAAIVIADGTPTRVQVDLEGINLDDRLERLAAYELRGRLAWPATEDVPAEAGLGLGWAGGFLYGIPFGRAELPLEIRAGRWRLHNPASVPLLDGQLQIERFELGDFVAGDEALLFEARLTPVSMRELARVLDWPPLSGTLSGHLPSLRYEDGILSLAGEFSAQVFSGTVAIRNLRVERPLEPLARLTANVELRGLELAEVTSAFAFGLMTGRLDGYVRELEMIGWQPVAFDARLYTPAGDRSRRRISQRAVDNIASLGGGGAGALGTGFLRFFDEFSYAAFALGCRLENDVCQMSGLDQRDQGYIILRGSGLPRIDVVGFASRVSWSALVQQLAAIMESEAPEIR